jgi:hypothetical protein
MKVGWRCLLCMKKAKSGKDAIPDNLSFSFLERDIDNGKVKAHWQKVKEKIEQQSSEPAAWEKDKNIL